MTHHAATFDNLLPQTRVCRTCQESWTEEYYSMALSDGVARFRSKQADKLTCNSCRTMGRGGTGYFEGELDWQLRAVCNDPLIPSDTFFPETTQELARETWLGFCGHCPVRQDCLSFGEKTEGWGVYGGKHLMKGLSENAYADKTSAAQASVKMFKDGETVTAIAKKTGFSRNTIGAWLDKAGVRKGADHRTRSSARSR